MSIKFPVMQAIRRGNELWDQDTNTVNVDRRSTVLQSMSRATHVEASAAGNIYWTSESLFDIGADYPPIRSPYPEIWMEWSTPNEFRDACGKWHPMPNNTIRHVFAVISDKDISELATNEFDNPAGRKILASAPPYATRVIFITGGGMSHLNDSIAIMSGMCLVYTNDSGELLGNIPEGGTWDDTAITALCNSEQHRRNLTNLKPALLAVGLMNCRNVQAPEKTLSFARSGSEKRKGIPQPKIKYHTIQLPGGGTQSDGKGGHRATAIHQVRGHFKTFTAEKPLLGQHVGTYWWGWQVRGSADKGIVVSDYKLDTAKHPA